MTKKIGLVLLLDDNLATNYLHKKFLEKVGFVEKVMECRSGINALSYLQQEDAVQPDLIFVDINMPIMDAWEFLEKYEKLKKDTKDTKIVLLSTSLSPSDNERAKKIPAIRKVLLKPITIEAITEIAEKYF